MAHNEFAAPQQFGNQMLSNRHSGVNPFQQSPINPLRDPRFGRPG
jgi:hypothetical protein